MNETAQKLQVMKDGTETKALYIKHMSKGDWEIIAQLQAAHGQEITVADIIRWAIRKAAGRL